MGRTSRLNFNGPAISRIRSSAFCIPTAAPESDGTLAWTSTTLVLVEADASCKTGIGFSYADTATAKLINDSLAEVVISCDALSVGYCRQSMIARIRNLGRPGICSMAISAVDNALWDLKAKLHHVPLVSLLGQVCTGVPIYGSGGFRSFPSSGDCESTHVGGALAPKIGAKAPPTTDKTMTYKTLKYYVSYFQEYFHSLSGLGTSKKSFHGDLSNDNLHL